MDARPPDPMRRQTSDGFIEAMCEMLIALGTAAAICIGVISLAAHLNETQKVRGIAENSLAPNVGEAEEGERGAIRLPRW